LEVDPFSEHHL